MFTLVRQCELKQDWQFFRELEPSVLRAVDFLVQLRDKARAVTAQMDGTVCWHRVCRRRNWRCAFGVHEYGLDSCWIEERRQCRRSPGYGLAPNCAHILRRTPRIVSRAAKGEMVRHPDGFEYLPMLANDDAAWRDPDPWNRPRPQTAQWALSHAIFPGGVFEKDDPIVTGHIALLQSCTREDVPAETGWLWHDSVWNYNASFAAHVYLWRACRSGLIELFADS